MGKKTRVTVTIDPEMLDFYQKHADEKGISFSMLVRLALAYYVQQKGKDDPLLKLVRSLS